MATDTITLAKNQQDVSQRANELNVEGEALLYRAFRHYWHPVVFSNDVSDGPVRAILCGQALVVVRLEGEICVFNDLCAHRGTALSLGKVVGDGHALRCAYHGWQYDREGRCILAPQRPDLSEHLRVRVRKYNAIEAYGMVWVCLEDEPRFPLPEFPQYSGESFVTVELENEDWRCSAPRRTENYCDASHLAWVHDGVLGDSNQPEVPDHEVWFDGRSVRMEMPFSEPAGTGKYESLGIDEEVTGVYRWTVFMPLTVRLDMDLDAGFTYTLFFHPTPLGPKETRNFTVGACNYGYHPDKIRQEVRDFQRLVYDQDRPVVESQRPEELPEDLSYELHLKGVDKFHLVYRRTLVDLAREVAGGA